MENNIINKRRGRPAKILTIEEIEALKNKVVGVRGRPKKVLTEEEIEALKNKVPGKRGRPNGASNNTKEDLPPLPPRKTIPLFDKLTSTPINRQKHQETKQNVVFDIDGVLLNFGATFLCFINNELKTDYKISDLTDYDFSKSLNIDPKKMKFLLYKFYVSHYISKLPLYGGVEEFMIKMCRKYNIYLITSIPTQYDEIKMKRRDNLVSIPYCDIIFTNEAKKSQFIKKLKPKYVFEDDCEQIQDYLDSTNNIEKIFVMKHSWNEMKQEEFEKTNQVKYYSDYNKLKYDLGFN